ncbi:hypothetical protein KEM55_000841 [Ascosphaera atra]|nr:hypothetical protein KEM55_000841 [Ascosphaera atra]
MAPVLRSASRAAAERDRARTLAQNARRAERVRRAPHYGRAGCVAPRSLPSIITEHLQEFLACSHCPLCQAHKPPQGSHEPGTCSADCWSCEVICNFEGCAVEILTADPEAAGLEDAGDSLVHGLLDVLHAHIAELRGLPVRKRGQSRWWAFMSPSIVGDIQAARSLQLLANAAFRKQST